MSVTHDPVPAPTRPAQAGQVGVGRVGGDVRGRLAGPRADAPWLVADIGGTNARFGLIRRPGGAPTEVKVLAGREYPGLAEAALDYLDGVRPAAACLAVAGPVTAGTFRMNNSPWTGTAAELREALGAGHLELINDFEALALSIPQLGAGLEDPVFAVEFVQQDFCERAAAGADLQNPWESA